MPQLRQTYRPEIVTLEEGQKIMVQGHPATAHDVVINPERNDAQRITYIAKFIDCPENKLLIGTCYDGGRYSLYSLRVL